MRIDKEMQVFRFGWVGQIISFSDRGKLEHECFERIADEILLAVMERDMKAALLHLSKWPIHVVNAEC